MRKLSIMGPLLFATALTPNPPLRGGEGWG
jgi:hypothetical protein